MKDKRFEYPGTSIPNISTLQNMNINYLLLGSLLSSIIWLIIVFLKFEEFSIELRIIMILSFVCLVLFINVIMLYIRDCQNYFVVCYQNSQIETIDKQVAKIKNKKN